MSSINDESKEELPRMPELKVAFTPDQWGPNELPAQFANMPYQQFNKGDRLRKICDWTKPLYVTKHGNARTANNNNNQYSYYHEEDESTFRLVDTTRVQKPAYQRGRFQQRNARGGRQPGMQVLSKGAKDREKKHQNKRWGRNFHIVRDASVMVKPDWVSLEDMDFARLGKLSLPGIKPGEDILCCGEMMYYNKTYDRVNVKNEKPLQRSDCVFHTVTTTDDPNIRKLSKGEGNVFATDAILATLMCSTRSKYSWDIVIEKVNGKIFFDKRDDSEFDLLTINETSAEQPEDDNKTINSARNLAIEATFINQSFTQQVLHSGPKESRFRFDDPNPFASEETEKVASVGYRYRKWDLGGGIVLVVRCENDAVIRSPTGEVQYLTVKALNEWDMEATNSVNWRQKLDIQRSAVLASELRNNACKLAKWTVQALLAGSNQIKFGYVSRVNFRENSKHVILGTQQYKPGEFAAQIKLNMDNAWGILRCIVDKIMKEKDGKYLIMREPNKGIVRLYDVPDNTFESEDEEEDEI